MLPFSPTVAAHIRFLLQSLNDSNFDSIRRELCEFVKYGREGSILLLQTCLDQLILNGGDGKNSQLKQDLVSTIFKYLFDQPNFCTVFCEALGGLSLSDGFLSELSKALNLSLAENIGIALALLESDNLEFRTRGHSLCIAQIEELTKTSKPAISNEQIQDVILFLCRSEGLSKHVDYFTNILSLLPCGGSSFLVQAPVLTDDGDSANSLRQLNLFYDGFGDDFEAVLAEVQQEMNMADILRELGYGCTINSSHCKEMLSLFQPLTEVTLSKLIGIIARTHVGLDDAQTAHSSFCSAIGSSSNLDLSLLSSWNIDVLVDAIKQLAPKTNWANVVENLDHEGFNVPDETAFSLLMSVYNKVCQDPFPLHAICGSVWKNAEGQLSFLKYAVSAPTDLFTFAHCSRQLVHADSTHFHKVVGNQAWTCLDLLDVLCQLAERGHASSVRLMLEQPLKQCPEVLLVGIAQVNSAYNLLQYEVFSAVFPLMLNDTTKSSVIHYLWRVNPHLVIRGFSEAHNPNSLLRILDICQELKILSPVLDLAPFSVCIKLAVIAYRKDYAHLEKWLTENLNMYKDAFVEDCLMFLKEILSDVNDVPSSLQQLHGPMLNAYQEACPILFKVLEASFGQLVSHQVLEELKKLHDLSNPKVQSTIVTESSTSDGSSDDIEREANTYFHQMFSGQLTTDAMVQMLARFKESSEKREQKIFDCMIANLFEEYKFFHKYPDRQLKLAAVLFGSLIKHQLVTHLTLGIALRGVLDALRKSVDSKMFMFGTRALEQFVDRLVEWPQYCNHILQISHLRGTHAELVSVIERALARISLSQAESNGGNSLPTDQQQVSAAASAESIEASETAWQFVNSGSSQLGQPLSPFQLQQKHQGFLSDRLKHNIPSISNSNPLQSHSTLPSLTSAPVDSVNNAKPPVQSLQASASQHSTTAPTAISSSPGFLRPSRVAPAGMLRQPSYSTGFGAALNIETLVAAAERRDNPIETPASEVQDKILFMINNISIANIEAKAKEFTEVLNEQYYSWFAQYMVMKRASIEPNFHDLYLKFLDKVNSRLLNTEIVKATYENCKVLLRSDLIKSSSEERSLLKNLGSWLGKFTIGRNQALRAKEIDPKALIIEAYEKGLMIAVIPFTSKILEPCQSSLAYRPPNPWTMGILGLLAEIYNLPNLKMNLKFDIEVLFKNLGVDMKDVKPTSLLKDRVREVEGNPDFSNKDINASQTPVVAEVNSTVIPTLSRAELQSEVNSTSHPNMLTQYTTPLHPVSVNIAEEEKGGPLIIPDRVPSAQGLTQVTPPQTPFSFPQLMPIIPNPDSYIKINPKLSSMGSEQFKRIMQMAMDKAVTDIVSPVIQRSVTIASRTTKELVIKDYAMESDDNAIFRAAHLMVATLAGSLAHVTCKEPLRMALSNHLRSLLQALNVTGEVMEHIVQILINDNLDLGCAVIENVASDKAVELIDGEIRPSFAAIRKQRETPGSAYYDTASYGQGPFARIPESLRPKPGRLSVGQQRVYNDFIRNIWQNQSSQSSSVAPAGPPGLAGGSVNSPHPRAYGSSSSQISSNIYSASQVAPGFSSAQPLDLAQEESDRGSAQLSISAAHGANDGTIQSAAEIGPIVSSFPASVPSPELMDTPTISKDIGVVVPPSSITAAAESVGAASSDSLLTTGDVLEKYELLAQKLETLIVKDARDSEAQGVIAEVPEIIVRCVSRDEAGLAVAQKVFKSLYENASNGFLVTAHLAILAAIRDVCKLVVKELTSWVIYSDEDRKFNKEITIGLFRYELLSIAEYDVHFAKLIDGGRNKSATEFAISLVQTLVMHEPAVSSLDLYNVINSLAKIAQRPGSPESLQQLVEIARNAPSITGFSANKDERARQSRDKKVLSGRSLGNKEENASIESASADPVGFREQVSHLFSDWCRMCDVPASNDSAYSHYVSQLHQAGLLKGDDIMDRFFRVLTELSVVHCLAAEKATSPVSLTLQSTQQFQHLSFTVIDAFAKLVVLVVKHLPLDQGSNKVNLLTKILAVIARVIQKDAEEKKSYFNPRPYFRLFVNWLLDLSSPDSALDGGNYQVLTSFAFAFHALQPLKVPGFSFAWLELVSHRSFMPKLLTTSAPKGWPFFQRLLVDLFKFMEPYLRNAELGEPVHFLYKGTLRVLLVLLHDFPEFLCDYHFSFCDVIPPSCIQMRNVILSAFPRNMRLPDPSTPNLKIDLLAEISQAPRIMSDVDIALKAKQIKSDIDEYLKTRPEGSPFLTELKQRLLLPQSEANVAGTRYNVPLINSLVLYVGMQAIQQLQSKTGTQQQQQQLLHSPPMDIFLVGAAMDIFQSLIKSLDTEGRYLFLNAVANQLRYPNNHTHYFSFVLLYLFAEAGQEIIQEQITRVLLERLIVNRPHPWGLLITFIELIKNPRYSFWSRSFTRCAPEIEKLFESVSRSCGGPKAVDDGMVSGSLTDGNH